MEEALLFLNPLTKQQRISKEYYVVQFFLHVKEGMLL